MRPPQEGPPRRIAAYARVSTTQQTAELQTSAIRDYADRRGWPEPEFFVDEGVSGSLKQRPSLDRLVAAARRRHFDVLVVWKLDRLGRSLGHLIGMLEELKQCGVDLVSVTESLDTTTPSGRALFGMLGVFAEFERDIIRERVIEGMRRAVERGVKIGRPRLEPTEKEIEELLELRRTGLSIRAISKRISWFPSNDGAARHPSPSLVHRTLKEVGDPLAEGGAG